MVNIPAEVLAYLKEFVLVDQSLQSCNSMHGVFKPL